MPQEAPILHADTGGAQAHGTVVTGPGGELRMRPTLLNSLHFVSALHGGDARGASAPAGGRVSELDTGAHHRNGLHLGESLADCGVRETLEETGVDVEITGIVGTYTNPGHVSRSRANPVRALTRKIGEGSNSARTIQPSVRATPIGQLAPVPPRPQ